jgi:hypothetical protein
MSGIQNPQNLPSKANILKDNATAFLKRTFDLASSKSGTIKLIAFFIIIILIAGISFYVTLQLAKKKRYPSVMKNMLDENYKPEISSINKTDMKYNYKLRDYYVKSSYNSCCAGDFKNDYVTLKALRHVVGQGARFLDFSIYNIDNKPVIAASSQDSIFYKETYNSLDFDDVIKTINSIAFSNSIAPNAHDPLFLHFKIYSQQKTTYDKMAQSINKHLGNRLLSHEYGKEYNGHSIGNLNLSSLMGNVIIITDKNNPDILEKSELYNYVNICTSTPLLQILNNYNVLYAPNYNEIISFNKKKMTISVPDLSSLASNISASIHQKYGIQFICINFQTDDNNLKYYENLFNKAGSAFILKPENLRFKPNTIKKPKSQDPKLSFAPRKYNKDYVQIQI